jgi:hypothetical protein
MQARRAEREDLIVVIGPAPEFFATCVKCITYINFPTFAATD